MTKAPLAPGANPATVPVVPYPIQRIALPAAALLLAMTAPGLAGEGDGGPWRSFDGSEFPVLKWLPERAAPPASAVVCVHGLSGAADDFEQLGERLSKAGHAVYAYNLRGQGKDPQRDRVGDIKRRAHWFADLDSFLTHVRRLHPGVPLFVYGESLGSLIVMHGYSDLDAANREAVGGLIYGSPVVALPGDLPPLKYLVIKLAIRLCPCVKVSMLKLAGGADAQVSGDAEVDHWEQMRKTPHFVEHMSLRLLGNIEDMVGDCAAEASAIAKPVLVMHPGNDVFTKPEQVEAFFDALGAEDKTRRLFEESHHLLFYDKEREELFDLVERWIGERS